MTKIKDEIKILSPQIPNELKSLDIGNSHIEDEDFFNIAIISDCYIEEQRAEKVIFESKFSKIGFSNIDMKRIQMVGVELKGMDLRTCNMEGIGVRIEDLNGAIVSNMQVIELAGLLGVVIKE